MDNLEIWQWACYVLLYDLPQRSQRTQRKKFVLRVLSVLCGKRGIYYAFGSVSRYARLANNTQ
jgi:hypothetical protein